MNTRFEISDEDRNKVIGYIKENGSITNRVVREILDISYDQAIYLFNTMLSDRQIRRIGKTSSTRYVLPE